MIWLVIFGAIFCVVCIVVKEAGSAEWRDKALDYQVELLNAESKTIEYQKRIIALEDSIIAKTSRSEMDK